MVLPLPKLLCSLWFYCLLLFQTCEMLPSCAKAFTVGKNAIQDNTDTSTDVLPVDTTAVYIFRSGLVCLIL